MSPIGQGLTPMREIQNRAKTATEAVITIPTPPLGKRIASGAPMSTKTIQVNAMAYFLWISTRFSIVDCRSVLAARALAREVTGLMGDAVPGTSQSNRASEPVQDALRTTLLRRPFERMNLTLTMPTCDSNRG